MTFLNRSCDGTKIRKRVYLGIRLCWLDCDGSAEACPKNNVPTSNTLVKYMNSKRTRQLFYALVEGRR